MGIAVMEKQLEKSKKASPEIYKALKLPTLDKDSPYNEICGLPGVSYEQNGKYFNTGGNPVDVDLFSPTNDTRDAPQSEEYASYNQVIYQESAPANKKSKDESVSIIYGDIG